MGKAEEYALDFVIVVVGVIVGLWIARMIGVI
jgi:uncharacterized membrane-anchored protein YhcB (DUF1043 family)